MTSALTAKVKSCTDQRKQDHATLDGVSYKAEAFDAFAFTSSLHAGRTAYGTSPQGEDLCSSVSSRRWSSSRTNVRRSCLETEHRPSLALSESNKRKPSTLSTIQNHLVSHLRQSGLPCASPVCRFSVLGLGRREWFLYLPLVFGPRLSLTLRAR